VNLSLFFTVFWFAFSAAFFRVHTICKKSFRPPFKIGLRNAGQSRRGGALRKEKRKNNKSRKVGKAQRPPEVKLSAPQFLCVSASAYRRQVFARLKNKKRISLPAILRGRLQSREGAKDSGRQFRFFLAT
jgi:hypothetical protein